MLEVMTTLDTIQEILAERRRVMDEYTDPRMRGL